ncbi:hypothetical protein EVA_10222 [gut metagenome]|uniref:Uncharacterized protein n=1 Tax=gut metagenome TaxID=749906 RepID=J9CNI5_9ZZZZ
MTVVTMILTVVAVSKTPSPSSPPTRTGKELNENEKCANPLWFICCLCFNII